MNSPEGDRCSWTSRAASIVMLVTLLFACAPSIAQTTQPVSANSIENQPIPRSSAHNPTTAPHVATTANKPGGIVDIQRVILALTIVLGIIFLLRFIGRRYFPAALGAKNAGAVRVLNRSAITHKQQVVLVQVGKRILVVADNGTQMNPLSEITDPDEVASLIGQLNAPRAATQEQFEAEFGKASEQFDEQIRPEGEQLASGEAQEAEPLQGQDLGLAQGEISGLMQKVRGLAKQLGRS